MPEALRDYFRAIERFVSQQRGQPLILSPQDFMRVFEWWDAGLPVEAVLTGLANFYEKKRKRRPGARVYTLAYADDEVLKAFAESRRRALGAELGVPADESEQTRARLRALAAQLAALTEPPALARHAAECAAWLNEAAARDPLPAPAELSRKLAEQDRELLALARGQLDDAARAALEKEVAAQFAELALLASDDAMRELLRARRLRQQLNLPRLGLYG